MNSPTMQAAPAQQPVAGLGALMSPSQPTKGASPESMGEIMALAKKLTDAQLADVLMGKSLDVPQFAALTEAMGRKSLRTAVQGAQAQQELNQPSLKQVALADMQMEQAPQMQQMQQPVMAAEGGLASLPAENMESMDLASGGIIAFADTKPGTETQMPIREDLTDEERKQLAENPYMQRVQGIRNLGNAFLTPRNYDPIAKLSDLASSVQKWGQNTDAANANWEASKKQRTGEAKLFTGEQTPKGKLVQAGVVSPDTPIRDVEKIANANLNRGYAIDREDAAAGAGMTALANAQKTKVAPASVGTDKRSADRKAALMGTDTGTGITPEKRVNPFSGLKADLPDYEKVKNQNLGEGLMVLSSAMFNNPNLSMAMGQGLPALAKISGASRKEISDLKKDYNAQQLNLGKANELFEQGQEDKAFKYLKQSQDHAYHMQTAMASMMQAGKPSDTIQTLNAIRKPGESMSDAFARFQDMKQEPKTDQALMAKFLDYQKSAAGILNPMTYPQFLQTHNLNSGAQVAGAGNTGYSAVYDASGRRIQ